MERKPCLRCNRAIDASARICPFCNWDQTEAYTAPIAEQEAQIAAPAPTAPREKSEWRKRLLIAIGGPLLLILSFALGLFLYRIRSAPPTGQTTHENTPATTSSSGRSESPRAGTVPLVAAGEAARAEQPITTAPTATNPANPADIQRTDITAASSVEYAALAARARSEQKTSALVDPRSITGPAYAAAAATAPPRRTLAAAQQTMRPTERPAMAAPPRAARTNPVPEFQPIPHISVDRSITATLELLVGSDGRVKEVNVREGIPGQTPRLIAAVQSWRFRPATENGVPVQAPFSVDISFHGRD